ncbi:hypothetical protein P23_2640 [Acinetobacter calcoaceticus]|uniref:hypothetical protein n=1 Tax=Acinetobacter calcoaceticus TaxID=471 RepID=UPI0005826C5F|nr:hypothetical protein [Acinetobacter calcoaceticus]GAM32119.1 hypothetical protein P23_2640 [Acinetobacter calcoaceticus]
MTSVVIWLNRGNDGNSQISAVADSRITHQTDNGVKRSLEIFPKLYELELKVSTHVLRINYSKIHSYGLAVAGNVTLCMAVKNVVDFLFGHLSITHDHEDSLPDNVSKQFTEVNVLNEILRSRLPVMEHVVNIVKNVANQVMYSHVQNTCNRREKFEIAVFGYCIRDRKYKAFNIVSETLSDVDFKSKKDDFNCFNSYVERLEFEEASDDIQFLLLGDKKEQISKLINEKIAESDKTHKLKYWRIPAEIIRSIVDEENYMSTIGSYAQTITVNDKFCRVGGGATKNTGLQYFGYRLGWYDEQGNYRSPMIGDYYFTPTGMDLNIFND